MKHPFLTILLTLVGCFVPLLGEAQTLDFPFKGEFANSDTGYTLHIDLYEETVEVPGLSFLGPMYGYLDAKARTDLYGVWTIVKQSIKGKKAFLRLSNDMGSDSQDITLTLLDDDTLSFEATGSNALRRVQGNKLVKAATSMRLQRVKTAETPEE